MLKHQESVEPLVKLSFISTKLVIREPSRLQPCVLWFASSYELLMTSSSVMM